MLPLPMNPSCTAARKGLGLVEEAALHQTSTLLGGEMHVARSEQESLVGDALHAAVERVGQSAGEVDQALGHVGVGLLQVEDHRDLILELVSDLLRLIETLRR